MSLEAYVTQRKTCPACQKEKWLQAFKLAPTDPFSPPCRPILVALVCRFCGNQTTADIPWPMFHVQRKYQHLPARWEDLNRNETYNYVKNWLDNWFVDDDSPKFIPGVLE